MRVVALDDLSGGFAENVPEGAARSCEGSVTDVALVERLFDEHRFDYVYHLAAYAAEGLSHFIRRFNYETNLVGSVNLINEAVHHDVELLRLHLVDRRLRREPDADDRGAGRRSPRTRTAISKYAVELDLAGGPRDVRPRLHGLPAAQRLRRAPEHRRPLPQRHRHLHEPGAAGAADDDLRRRHADARLLPHRRRRADHRARSRSCRRRATRSSTSAPTSRTPSTSWPTRWRGRSGSTRRGRTTCRRATRCSTPSRATRRWRGCSAPSPAVVAARRHRPHGRVGAAARADAPGRVPQHRGAQEPAAVLEPLGPQRNGFTTRTVP